MYPRNHEISVNQIVENAAMSHYLLRFPATMMSERHACRLMGLGRTTHRYRARKAERDSELRTRLKELAARRMRFGYQGGESEYGDAGAGDSSPSLLQTSSPLNINRELTLGLKQRTGHIKVRSGTPAMMLRREPRLNCSFGIPAIVRPLGAVVPAVAVFFGSNPLTAGTWGEACVGAEKHRIRFSDTMPSARYSNGSLGSCWHINQKSGNSMKSLLAIFLLLVLAGASDWGKSSSDNSSVNGGGGSGSGGGGGGGDGSSVIQYEFVFTDGMLYIYSIDSLSSTPVKKVSIPTATGTRGSVGCVGSKTIYISYGGDGQANRNGSLAAISLTDFSVKWKKQYTHGIDSHAVASDCSKIYMPDGELARTSGIWHVVDARN